MDRVELNILEEFKQDFKKIKEMGFIDSKRLHDTGIGKTFEDFIGVIENNKAFADYKGIIELKSGRELSQSMITLFTKSPEPKKINNILREEYGYYDGEHRDMKILHTTIVADKFNTCKGKFAFILDINGKEEKVNIKIKNMENNYVEDVDIYYSFETLRKIIDKKCKYIIFISAETKKDRGKELFKFSKAILLSGLTFEKFLDALKNGIIKYDVRIGVYRTGKLKGKTHDHGSGFRIFKSDLNKAFNINEID